LKGFIKDYRQELESDIWLMPPLYHRVWQYLKYKANHKPNKIPMSDGTFFDIQPGQHLTSLRGIAQGVGYYEGMSWKEPNPKTITTIINWLEKQGMVTVDKGKGNRQYTLITLLNWESYQSINNGGNSKETVDGSGTTQRLDINKNDKECIKNDKESTAADAGAREEPGYSENDTGNEESPGATEEQITAALLQHYLQLKGQMHPSPKDHEAALEVGRNHVPIKQAIQYLDEKFQEFNKNKKHSRDQINSLNYCTGYILDRYYEEKEGAKGGKHPKRNGSFGKTGGKSAEDVIRQREAAKQAWS